MVLHKWAAVSKSAPPPAGLRPLAKVMHPNPKLRPDDYKIPYVLRTFIKDRHTSEVQHLENRGMYREELAIERSRFPRLSKALAVQTDGSLNEKEFEFALPPVMIIFQDRLSAHRQRQVALAKMGRLNKEHSWTTNIKAKPSMNTVCNALAYPYCIPKKYMLRPRQVDPLTAKHGSGASKE